MKIILANANYQMHMTDEGWQLQEGLAAQGWVQVGCGYPIGETNIHRIMERVTPTTIFIQDARDWDRTLPSCYDSRVSFENIEALSGHPAVKIVVCKDAGSVVAYQQEIARKVDARLVVTYYHDQSVLPLSPWLASLQRIRTYHSVDAEKCARLYRTGSRTQRVILTGAIEADVYPIRAELAAWAARMPRGHVELDVYRHPGYGAQGTQTPAYLRMLSYYRVHVATASRFGFALRKIIESVAMGCTPVTNLPVYDRLPMIDGALVRIPNDASLSDCQAAIALADERWDPDERLMWAQRAWTFYDYRTLGARLSMEIAHAERALEMDAVSHG